MEDRFEPEKIDVARDEGVTISFHDGYIVHFDLVTLRHACPCATCRSLTIKAHRCGRARVVHCPFVSRAQSCTGRGVSFCSRAQASSFSQR